MGDIPFYEEGIGHLDEPELRGEPEFLPDYLQLIVGDVEDGYYHDVSTEFERREEWNKQAQNTMAIAIKEAIDNEILGNLNPANMGKYAIEIMNLTESKYEFIHAPTMKDITKYTSTSKIIESIQRRFRHG